MFTERFDIRPWQEQDLSLLARLESRVQAFPWSLRFFSESFSAGHAGWVLVQIVNDQSEQPLAFAVSSSVLDESSLLNIGVDDAWQGQGLGRRLLSHVIAALRDRGQQVLQLEVRCSNRRAIALYESLGFHLDGVRKAYYPAVGEREDALLYSLQLTNKATDSADSKVG